MATFTTIPESNISEILSSLVGKTTGVVVSKSEEILDKIEEEILKQVNGTVDQDSLNKVKKQISNIEDSISKLEESISSVESSLTVLEKPVSALDTAMKAIKAVPVPVPPPVTVSLTVISELIAQIKQTASAGVASLTSLVDYIAPVKERISKIKKALDTLTVSDVVGSASDKDKEVLEDCGITEDILRTLTTALLADGLYLVGFGSISDVDLHNSTIIAMVRSNKTGTVLQLPVYNTGDSILYAYKKQGNKPDRPTTREKLPDGWVDIEPEVSDVSWWYSRAVISGISDKVEIWTEPELFTQSVKKSKIQQGRLPVITQDCILHWVETGDDIPDLKGDVLLAIEGSDKAYNLFQEILKRISNIGALKSLEGHIGTATKIYTSSNELKESDYQYISADGTLYCLEILTDPDSSSAMPLRYVIARASTGNLVYEGSRSYANEDKTFLDEAKIYLSQLGNSTQFNFNTKSTADTGSLNSTIESILDTSEGMVSTAQIGISTEELTNDFTETVENIVKKSGISAGNGSTENTNVSWKDEDDDYGTLTIGSAESVDLSKHGHTHLDYGTDLEYIDSNLSLKNEDGEILSTVTITGGGNTNITHWADLGNTVATLISPSGSTTGSAETVELVQSTWTGSNSSIFAGTASNATTAINWSGKPDWIGSSKPTYNLDEVSDGTSRKLSDYLTVATFNSWTGSSSSIFAGSAARLSNNASYKAWGQTYWSNGVPSSISGSLTDVSSITFKSGNNSVLLELDENGALKISGSVYATGAVSAYGSGSGGGGGGRSNVYWIGNPSGSATATLSAPVQGASNNTNVTLSTTLHTHYIGTTAVQSSPANQALGGISSLQLTGGRTGGTGDDEGIVIATANNNYAGVCLGTPTGRRSVFYYRTDTDTGPFWRFNDGTLTFDIFHPGKAGTIALTSDIPNVSWGTAGTDYIPLSVNSVSKNLLTSHQDISGKLDKNATITGATKCKITYDSKGLVTSGADLAASDIPNLAASKITSGTFDSERIPTIELSKLAQGIQDVLGLFEKDTTSVSGTTLIKAKYALYSDYEITAGGIGSGGGGGSNPFQSVAYASLSSLTEEDMSKIPTAWSAKQLLDRVATLENTTPNVSWGTAGTDYIPLSVNNVSKNLLTSHQSLAGYATENWVNNKGYLTGITSSQVTTALGYTPYNSTNPSGFISGITKEMVEAVLTGSISSHSHAYLPLSGGTLSSSENILSLNSSSPNVWVYFKVSSSNRASVGFYNNFAFIANEVGNYARIGVTDSGVPQYWNNSEGGSGHSFNLFHSGNLTPSDYLKKADGGTINGPLTIESGNDAKIILNNTDNETKYQYISFQQNGIEYARLGTFADSNLRYVNGGSPNLIWHQGNFNPYNYLQLSGGVITGTIQMNGGGSNTPLVRNWTYTATTGWAREIATFKVDGNSKFYIGAFGVYTVGAENNGIDYAYIGCNSWNGLNLRITPTSLKWGTDVIYHSGNCNNISSPWSASSLTLNGAISGATNITANGSVYSNRYGASGYVGGAAFVFNKGDDYFGIGPSATNINITSLGTVSNTTGTWKSEQITIWTDGKVGIGTTSPSYKLDVSGTINTNIGVKSRNVCIECGSDGSAGTYHSEINNFQSNLYLQQKSTTNAIICNGGGYVGIGTTTPSYKLHVNGSAYATSLTLAGAISGATTGSFSGNVSVGGTLSVTSAITANGGIKLSTGQWIESTSTGNGFLQNVNDVNMILGTANGNVKVRGTMTVGRVYLNSTNTAYIEYDSNNGAVHCNVPLYSDGEVTAGGVGSGGGGGSWSGGTVTSSILPSSDFDLNLGDYGYRWYHIFTSCINGGGESLDVTDCDGNVYFNDITIHADAFLDDSDERKKHIISYKYLSLSEINSMRSVLFNFYGKQNVRYGTIAQDVLQVLPEVVATDKLGYYSLDYGNLAVGLALSLGKISQNHEDRIAALESQIADLTNELNTLKAS